MMTKNILQTLQGTRTNTIPIWFMRQAGRYLPEYHKIRAQAGSFLNLCYNPVLATEVSLQPLRRFDLDASIFFADILVIPDALGQKVTFKDGIGPVLHVPDNKTDFLHIMEKNIPKIHDTLNPLYETLDRLKIALPNNKTLLGFSGCPWTIATYMILGHGKKNLQDCLEFFDNNSHFLTPFIEILCESIAEYCIKQIYAGADVIQLFESWAGVLYGRHLEILSEAPITKIIAQIKKVHPKTPIIVFAKNYNGNLEYLYETTHCDAVSLTSTDDIQSSTKIYPVQGCLDPQILKSGIGLEQEIYRICDILKDRPHIFNLSHGINKETPISHVEKAISIIKGYK